MHEPGAVAKAVPHRRQHAVDVAPRARAALYREPERLVQDKDIVQTAIADLRADIENDKLLLQNLDVLFDKEQRNARDLAASEQTEAQLKDESKAALAGLTEDVDIKVFATPT